MITANTWPNVHPIWPLLIGFGAAAWFGIVGHRNRHAAAFWAAGGLVLGSVIGTISSGLAFAVTLPSSYAIISRH